MADMWDNSVRFNINTVISHVAEEGIALRRGRRGMCSSAETSNTTVESWLSANSYALETLLIHPRAG